MTKEQQTQDQLQADIARQRADLADTVTQMQERLDVRSRAQAKFAELKDRATTDAGRPRPAVVGGVAGASSLATAAMWALRSHHDSERKQMSKISMLAAGGVGYVLGAKAGRPRYEQLRDQAHKVADNPSVRHLAHDAAEGVKQQAPLVKERVTSLAQSATHRIRPGNGEHVREEDFVEPFPPRSM